MHRHVQQAEQLKRNSKDIPHREYANKEGSGPGLRGDMIGKLDYGVPCGRQPRSFLAADVGLALAEEK